MAQFLITTLIWITSCMISTTATPTSTDPLCLVLVGLNIMSDTACTNTSTACAAYPTNIDCGTDITNPNITSLNFNKYSVPVSGTISTAIGSLTNLHTLDLGDNTITSSLPTDIGLLVNLVIFSVYANSLDGSIPAELGSMTALQVLDLHKNSLNSTVPNVFGPVSGLLSLDISSNSLVGAIPDSFCSLVSLTSLSICDAGVTNTTGCALITSVPPCVFDTPSSSLALLTVKNIGSIPASTSQPTESPTSGPTEQPTTPPSEQPTEQPTASPTEQPTMPPTESPTKQPTASPTASPVDAPTEAPTNVVSTSSTAHDSLSSGSVAAIVIFVLIFAGCVLFCFCCRPKLPDSNRASLGARNPQGDGRSFFRDHEDVHDV